MSLWKKGKSAWNAWAVATPVSDVDFSQQDFSKYRNVSFDGFVFPKGKVDFSNAKFGDGDVDFSDTSFGDGDVDFQSASFGEGRVFFFHANFGEGLINFSNTSFGKGDVYFLDAKFGVGDVYFFRAKFGKGQLDFSGASFGAGNVYFNDASFGEGAASFHLTTFGGSVTFINLRDPKKISNLTFQYARFEKLFALEGSFTCVPDLRSTRTDHHIDINNLKIDWSIEAARQHSKDRDNADDLIHVSARLQRLREIAENNKHHEAAYRFFADEMRARRWTHKNTFASLIDLIYDKVSDYGQSIFRPFVGLFLTAYVAKWVYALQYVPPPKKDVLGNAERLGHGLSLALGNMVPFLPTARQTWTDSAEKLFGDNPGLWLDILMLSQGALSFVFLFLIGLALRNRFRL